MAQNEAAQKAAAQVRNFILLLLEQMYQKLEKVIAKLKGSRRSWKIMTNNVSYLGCINGRAFG